MSLEEFTPHIESPEGGGNSAESSKEQSEKFKEQAKKSSAGIKRTKKDEKKAKKGDILLANFLVKIILNKKFDPILGILFKLTDNGYPSNFLIGILSLIYIEISDKLREENEIEKISFNYRSEEIIDFDDSNIAEEIKDRINNWIEDIIMSVSSEYSSILTERLIILLEKKDDNIIKFISDIFNFFLKETNIKIKEKESINIANFIISQTQKKIKKLNIELV